VSPSWSHDRRIAAAAIGTSVVVALGIAAIVAFVVPSSPAHSNAGATSSDAPGGVTATLTDLTTGTSPTAEPTLTQTASPGPSPAPETTTSTTPARDRVAPKIGAAATQYSEIWTDFWCAAGPTRTQITFPVRDSTDAASALTVKVRFVLHREDKKTVNLDQKSVSSKSSTFTFQFGPYPGPNDDYTYSNVVDLVVTATDRAGNRSTRTFASLVQFMDCKA
jgi:hypothetical protein